MRTVLFIVPILGGGGAERVIVTLLRNLDRTRFRAILAVIDTLPVDYRSEIPADVEFVNLDCARVRNAIPKVVRLVRRIEPDVVFSTLGHLNLALAALTPIMPRRSAFIGREGTIVTERLKDFSHPGLWRAAYRALYPRFDAVVCQSKYMQRDLVENYGLAREKTVVINNPIDLERIGRGLVTPGPRRAPGGPLRLVAAGRLSKEKGYDLLLDALALLRDMEISLTILGQGPLQADLRARVDALALGDAVSLVGFQENPHRYFAEADALVLSSRYEGFPNVVLEALASGIGVISTPAVGGVSEILEGVSGSVLADAVSAPALAKAIRKWAAEPFLGISPSVLDRYRASAIADQYSQLFDRVCERR